MHLSRVGFFCPVISTQELFPLPSLQSFILHLPPTPKGPGARAFHCAAAEGSKMYVFGGRDGATAPRPDLWCLDCETWTWFLVNPLTFPPAPR